ncbi:hypothetical protein GCK72_025988 [Caenorhabditis remanei]|uniref:histone acetyltransferase n=1 Tax=Caenorhabditis remanei TaxID=31234 RepID=A0A6A5G3N4_CAERE|nr:hypothetical protein GCK72_025988 [Caenorhabditis remanei]KAF1749520.1 hypothetical protein GCK72_025988 [Caenorhabditis remanei]
MTSEVVSRLLTEPTRNPRMSTLNSAFNMPEENLAMQCDSLQDAVSPPKPKNALERAHSYPSDQNREYKKFLSSSLGKMLPLLESGESYGMKKYYVINPLIRKKERANNEGLVSAARTTGEPLVKKRRWDGVVTTPENNEDMLKQSVTENMDKSVSNLLETRLETVETCHTSETTKALANSSVTNQMDVPNQLMSPMSKKKEPLEKTVDSGNQAKSRKVAISSQHEPLTLGKEKESVTPAMESENSVELQKAAAEELSEDSKCQEPEEAEKEELRSTNQISQTGRKGKNNNRKPTETLQIKNKKEQKGAANKPATSMTPRQKVEALLLKLRDEEKDQTLQADLRVILRNIIRMDEETELMKIVLEGLKERIKEEKIKKVLEICRLHYVEAGFCCGRIIDDYPLIKCNSCGQYYHHPCREIGARKLGAGEECSCRTSVGMTKWIRSTDIPANEFSNFMEENMKKWVGPRHPFKVRSFLTNEMSVEFEEIIKHFYLQMEQPLPNQTMRNRMVLVFMEKEDKEILFCGIILNEYTSPFKSGLCSFKYLDTVSFINDRNQRAAVHNSILLSYLEYAKKIGYTNSSLWACPPKPSKYYLLKGRPAYQTILSQEQLIAWYFKLLQDGEERGILLKVEQKYTGPVDADLFKLMDNLMCDDGYWNAIVAKKLESYPKIKDMGVIDNEEEKKAIAKDLYDYLTEQITLEKSNKHPILDIQLVEKRTYRRVAAMEKDALILPNSITNSRDEWMNFQEKNRLNYSCDTMAIFSSQITLQQIDAELKKAGLLNHAGPSPSTSSSC